MSELDFHQIRPLTGREFEQIRQLAYQTFGLDLKDGKEHLVSARLGKLIRQLGLGSFREYLEYVQDEGTGSALTSMVDALTTNYTSFNREPAHFEFLRSQVIPQLRNHDRISIWSAACSTGEEPYTLAFCLLEELGPAAASRMHVLATDISTRALEVCRAGIYPAERFQVFPLDWHRKYLLRGSGKWKGSYRVKNQVARLIEFQQRNLMDNFTGIGPFPVIFCRNVMIYFDKTTQENLVNRMAACLEPGGYLMLGHSEGLSGINHPLTYVRPAIYRKPTSILAGSRT
jgi:chemotaxis protein methyltransferase CheR